jgi:NTP pyrophosphatase (non-canonical NTP hydrolase)
MDFQDYQQKARETAIYPSEHSILYPTLGLCGEAGEVAEKVKKVIRDKGGEFDEFDRMSIRKELGDVLWYMAQICSDLDLRLESIAIANVEKLRLRKEKGTLSGSGDDR